MQILDQCTLLQAAEYIAFGWEPLSKEEDFTERRIRYYIGETDEKYNNILDEQLMDLDRAKMSLFALIDNGLSIIDENEKPITIDSTHVVEHNFGNLHLGLEYETTFIDEDGFIEDPFIVVRDIELNAEKTIEIYKKPRIPFFVLEEAYKQYKEKVPAVDHEYNLILENRILYLQRDNDEAQRKLLHKFSDDTNNFRIFNVVISGITSKQVSSEGTITYEHEDINHYLVENNRDESFTKALYTVIEKLRQQDAFDMFFNITAKKIIYKPTVNDSFLYKNGLPIPKF